MNALPQTNRPIPFYGPMAVFNRLMARLKTSPFPRKVTSSSLTEIGMRPDEAYRIVSGFKALGWIDEDANPGSDLSSLVAAYGGETWRETLRMVLQRTYSFVPDDWEGLTPKSLHRAFVSHTGRDIEAVRSAETFFLTAVTEAGISLSAGFAARLKRAKPSTSDSVRQMVVERLRDVSPPLIPATIVSKSDQFMEQLLDLIALADDPGMSAKEKEAILIVAAYLRRRAKSEKR